MYTYHQFISPTLYEHFINIPNILRTPGETHHKTAQETLHGSNLLK